MAVWWVFLAGVLALVVVLAGFVVVLVISQRRVVRVEREHARKLLQAQEAERAWVAREVHDDVLQRVAAVRSEVEFMEADTEGRMHPADSKKLAALKIELDDLSEVLRSVAHRLHPSLVEKAGLVAALRSLQNEVGRSLGLQIELNAPERLIALPLERGLAAYRIAQEALRNVSRHSGVNSAELTIRTEPERLLLSIRDRGCGFQIHADGDHAGLGLVAMQERAALAGGWLEVTSRPGGGTEVEVSFPIETT